MNNVTLEQLNKSLAEAEQRLLAVQEHGDAVISKHDLRNGYNADFYLNKCPILQNSVNFYKRKILQRTKGQLSLF